MTIAPAAATPVLPTTVSDQLRRIMVWPACALLVGTHLYWGDESYTQLCHVLAGLLGCLTLVATAYAPRGMLPGAPIMLLYYYVAMGRPTFSPAQLRGVNGPIWLSSQSFEFALMGALLFATTLLVASRVTGRWGAYFGARVARYIDPPEPYDRSQTTVARASSVLSILMYSIINLRTFPIPTALMLPVFLISSPAIPLGLLFWDWRKTRTLGSLAWFWGAVAFCSVLGISDGVLGAGVLSGLIAVALLWMARGRIPGVLVAAGVAVFLFLNPAKMQYRKQTWYLERDVTLFERFEAWTTALYGTYSTSTEAAVDASVEATAYRTSTLPFVALVYEMVPRVISHEGPERWLELPIHFVPRVFWAGKPSYTDLFNNDFTVRFGLQTPAGLSTTTLNLPSVADGYWRVGWLGVFIEGLLLGTLLGLFQGATRVHSRGLLMLGIGFVVSTQADKHVFYILASLPQYLFATTTILLAVRFLALVLLSQVKDPTLNTAPAPRQLSR